MKDISRAGLSGGLCSADLWNGLRAELRHAPVCEPQVSMAIERV